MTITFLDIIKSDKPTLVDFFTEWCGPCKMMKLILAELKTSVGENATILTIDLDKNPQVASTYQIQGVPTLIIFKNGKIKWRQSGVASTNQLQKLILQHLN